MLEVKYLNCEEMEDNYLDEMMKNEAINQLIIGNIIYTKKSILKNNELDERNIFGVILDDNKVLYFFCNFLPYNLVLTPNGDIDNELEKKCAELFVKSLLDNNIFINGIQSTDTFCEYFIEQYPGEFELRQAMDIMYCDKVNDYPLSGIIRLANEDDMDEIVKMWMGFQEDALNIQEDYEKGKETFLIRFADKDCLTWIYEVNDKIVGMNGSTRKLPHGRSITYVYIKPEERLKGYCKEMISTCTKYYLDNGNDYTCLYVNKKNPYSNASYLAVGYQYLKPMYSYDLIRSII